MAEGKKSFQLYTEWIEIFEALDDDIAGRLIKHIFRYVNDQQPESDDKIVQIAFIQIKQQLKRDLIKWEKKAETNRINGLLGGRPKTQKNPKEPSGLIDNPQKPVKVEVEVKDKVKVKEKVKGKSRVVRFSAPPFDELNDYFFERLQSKETAHFEAQKFFDFYQSKGWMVGKNKMKDWRAAVRQWILRMNEFKKEKSDKGNQFSEEAVRSRMERW